MFHRDATTLTSALTRLLPEPWLRKQATEVGAVTRRRKVDIVALFWSVVLGFGVSQKRSIADLRRSYENATGTSLEESSFYDRLTEAFAKLLERAVPRAIEALAPTAARLRAAWNGFKDLLCLDSTVVRLHDLLGGVFAGTRTNQSKAAAKLHVVMSVLSASPARVRLTPERTSDQTPWRRVGRWVQDHLLLFDLGYFNHHLFARIDANGGFFVTRLKSNSNPVITDANRLWRGRSRRVVEHKLLQMLPGLKRETLDFMARFKVERRRYRGHRSTDHVEFRVVGVREKASGQYHLYVTNIPVERMGAEQLAETYRLRWQIELLFKELKTHYRLAQLPSGKANVVRILLYAAILTLLASRALLDALSRRLPPDRHIPPLRWAAVFATIVPWLLTALADRTTRRGRRLDPWQLLLSQAMDPNLGRPPAPCAVLDRVGQGG